MSKEDKQPEVRLDEDGEHIVWCHQCNWKNFNQEIWHEFTLSNDPQHGWVIVSKDPLTVTPSILCMSCGTHGFWQQGKWVPA